MSETDCTFFKPNRRFCLYYDYIFACVPRRSFIQNDPRYRMTFQLPHSRTRRRQGNKKQNRESYGRGFINPTAPSHCKARSRVTAYISARNSQCEKNGLNPVGCLAAQPIASVRRPRAHLVLIKHFYPICIQDFHKFAHSSPACPR